MNDEEVFETFDPTCFSIFAGCGSSCGCDAVIVKEVNTNTEKGSSQFTKFYGIQFATDACKIGSLFDRPILWQSKADSTNNPRSDVGSVQNRFICHEDRVQGDYHYNQ